MVHINVDNFFMSDWSWHYDRGELLINFFTILLVFVKMSVPLANGDNRFTTFPHLIYIHYSPLSTTDYGHDDSVKTNFPPLTVL